MTPEAQRIAIAEACGVCTHPKEQSHWEDGDRESCGYGWCDCGQKTHWNEPLPFAGIPDYLNDLNAMHEAEKTLTPAKREKLSGDLMDLVRRDYELTRRPGELLLPMSGRRACLEATVAQRAEAFLRTLSLWDDAR